MDDFSEFGLDALDASFLNPMLTTATSIPQRSGGHHQPRVMADFSEFEFDALDASFLTPHMLQDISLTGMTGINGQLNSNLNAMNAMNSGENLSISSGAQNTTGNANTMWSDIGNTLGLLAEKNKTGSSSPCEMYHSTPTRSSNSRAAFTPARQASTRYPVVDIIDLTTPPRDSNPSEDQQDEASDSGGTKTPFLWKLPKLTQIRNIQHNLLPGPSTSHILMNSKINSGSTSRPSSSVPTEFGLGTKGKKERYFLQHNVQAKGLQGQRLVNPKIPLLIPDSSLGGVPAFNPSVARKGTIPHLTPNSGKLNSIGNVGKMPRKEKKIINCRVYPVRQTEHHEVTEIKFHRLEMERRRLLSRVNNMKQTIVQRSQNPTDNTVETRQEIAKIFEASAKLQMAEQIIVLAKKVLESRKAGVPNGEV